MRTPKPASEKTPGDPTIAFRIPIPVNNEVEILKHEIRAQDGSEGTRTDVGRSLFIAILGERDIVESILQISKERGSPFANTLRAVLRAGLRAFASGSAIADEDLCKK